MTKLIHSVLLLASCVLLAAGAPPTNEVFHCPQSEGYFPSVENCRYYYLCQKNVAYRDICPKGKLFDTITRRCQPSAVAVCANSLTTSQPETTATPVTTFTCPVQNGRFPHEDRCQSYYQCFNWLPYLHECPNGQLFDHRERVCTDAEKASCFVGFTTITEASTSGDNTPFVCPVQDGYYPHEKDCQSFYMCYKGRPNLQLCSYNELFDSITKKCVDAEKATCHNGNVPDVSTSSSVKEPSTTAKPDTTTTTTTASPSTIASTTEATTTPRVITSPSTIVTKPTTVKDDDSDEESWEIECPESDGLFPHPTDRHSYLHCQGGYPYIKKCPNNLIFNDALKTCSWA